MPAPGGKTGFFGGRRPPSPARQIFSNSHLRIRGYVSGYVILTMCQRARLCMWMNSPGHRANILNCAFVDVGVGFAEDSTNGYFWTQNFGTPAN